MLRPISRLAVVLFITGFVLGAVAQANAQGVTPTPPQPGAREGVPSSVPPSERHAPPNVQKPAPGAASGGQTSAPATAASGAVTDGGGQDPAGGFRVLTGESIGERLQRLLTTQPVPTTQPQPDPIPQGSSQGGDTKPAYSVKQVKSLAEEDLPIAGDPSLRLERAQLKANVWNNVASCELELDWMNPTGAMQEAVYYLPMTDTMLFTGLELSIHSAMESGEQEDFTRAQDTYEQIKRRKLDPAILDVFRTDVARLRIFPIEPGQRKKVRVHWIQMVSFVEGRFQFQFPTTLHSYLRYTMGSFRSTVRLATSFPRKLIGSATTGVSNLVGDTTVVKHDVAFSRLGNGISLVFENKQGDRPFASEMRLAADTGGGFFLKTAYVPPARRVSKVDEAVSATPAVAPDGKDVCARTWGDATAGRLTLFVGRCDADAAGATTAKVGPFGPSVADAVRFALEQLWAGQKMESISESLSAANSQEAMTIKELGRDHGVLTPFSALLVVEEGAR